MRLRVLKPPSHRPPLLLRILRKAVQIFVDFTKMWYGLCPDGSRCGHIAQRSNIQLVPDDLCGYLSLVPGRPVRKDLRTHSIIFGVSTLLPTPETAALPGARLPKARFGDIPPLCRLATFIASPPRLHHLQLTLNDFRLLPTRRLNAPTLQQSP